MLSQLDNIIYPDRCEVYEIVPSQRYFYPIFKNGSSSVMMTAREKGWRLLLNEQIKRAKNIDTILRDPEERIRSGINTYVQQVKNAHPNLDHDTVLWFAINYPFLNRHYSPQISWLINLYRYTSPDTLITFNSMASLRDFATFDMKPPGIIDEVVEITNLNNFEMYIRLDTALMNTCLGKSLTFNQIIQYIKLEDPKAYDYCVSRFGKITKLLYALPQD